MKEEKMKFCPTCGSDLEEGAKFCQSCGQNLKDIESEIVTKEETEVVPETEETEVDSENTKEKSEEIIKNDAPEEIPQDIGEVKSFTEEKEDLKNTSIGKKLSNKQMSLIGGAFVVVVALIFIIINNRKTVDLNDYVTIDIEGYDTVGTADVIFDKKRFYKENEEKFANKFDENADFDIISELQNEIFMEELWNGVDWKLDKSENLKNGDKVTLKWDCDDEIIEEAFDIKFKYKDITKKVEGLKKCEKINPFKNVKVDFSGISSQGVAEVDMTINENNDLLEDVYFNIKNNGELKNGDTVIVYIDKDTIDDYAEVHGKILSPTSKKFKVTGLKAYAEKTSDIPKQALLAMKKQADDEYNSTIAERWNEENEVLVSRKFIGTYFLKAKKGYRNDLILVYKNEIRHIDKDSGFNEVVPVYWYCAFNNVMVDDKGKVDVESMNYTTPYNSVMTKVNKDSFFSKSWSNYGYESLDKLYKDVVTSKINNFKHEDKVSETTEEKVKE